MDNGSPCERRRIQRLQDALGSLNIAFAITSSLFIYDRAHHLADAPKILQESLEGFSRTLGNIASLAFHQHKQVNLLRSELIREAVFLGLTLGIALLLYILVRLLTRSAAGRRVLVPLSCIAALLAVPVSWLYIVHATWDIYNEPKTFDGTYGLVSALELTVACALVYLVRNQPTWRGTIVFALHYIFWMLMMLRHLFSPLVGLPLSLMFPASGVAWLRYVQALRSRKEA